MDLGVNICSTCLSTDRHLIPLRNMKQLLKEIKFTELKSSKGAICWECKSNIMKFHRFKTQALLAQATCSTKIKRFFDFVSNRYRHFLPMDLGVNICSTCLSTDRHLIPLRNMKQLLKEIKFTELKSSKGAICWECKSNIMKFHRFKTQALLAQATCSTKIKCKNIKPFTRLVLKVNLSYDDQYSYNDTFTNCHNLSKTETDDIKENEIKEENNQNCDDNDNDMTDINEKPTDMNENVPDSDDNLSVTDEKLTDSNDNLSEMDVKLPDSDENLLEMDNKLPNSNDKLIEIDEQLPNSDIILPDSDEKLPETDAKLDLLEIDKAETIFVDTIKSIKIKKNVKKPKINRQEIADKFVKVEFSEEEILKNREDKRNHYNFKKIPFKCDSCVVGFTRKETYDKHLEKKHDKNIGPYICDICQVRFTTQTALNNHRLRHYSCYKCQLCNYSTTELWSALNHCKLKHESDTLDNIHCKQCDVIVKTARELEDHMQSEHSLHCNECGVKFKGKHTLRSHKARMHARARTHSCAECARTFSSARRLEAHAARHSAGAARALAHCTECRVTYKNIYVYRNHLRNSPKHSERAYSCPDCDKKFASKVYWSQHYNFYHLHKSQYNCDICNKLFISEWRLRNHRQTHHGLSRPRDHVCNVCGNKFFTSSILRNHKLTHSDQRSYMCEDCGDTFKQRPALYTHARLVHAQHKR